MSIAAFLGFQAGNQTFMAMRSLENAPNMHPKSGKVSRRM
jgi:hypothetical protein